MSQYKLRSETNFGTFLSRIKIFSKYSVRFSHLTTYVKHCTQAEVRTIIAIQYY